jgi:hypothetical protein
MYEELHVLSPVVPTREFCFLRYCRQIEHGLWAIADISVDLPNRDARFGAPPQRSCRLPSGCLIADMANGYSKVGSVRFGYLSVTRPLVFSIHVPRALRTYAMWLVGVLMSDFTR